MRVSGRTLAIGDDVLVCVRHAEFAETTRRSEVGKAGQEGAGEGTRTPTGEPGAGYVRCVCLFRHPDLQRV
jgi:hypothetical protein